MSSKKQGEGFAPPNYTQTPNTLFDLLPVISNAELRVTLVFVRETHGWHRQKTDMLSVPDIASLAGLSESSAKTGIKEAMQRGTLKRFKVRDDHRRQTYKYGLVISDRVTREEFERPKKQGENTEQNDAQGDSSSQNLTGSEFDRVNGSPGQNLPGSPEDSSSQNLPGSYKEERNSLLGKEKREEAAPPTRSDPPSESLEKTDPTQDPATDVAAPGGASEATAPPVQVPAQSPASAEPGKATNTEKVPGGGAAARGETEAWLRRKLSHAFIDRLLEELPPLGVDRRRDWFALPLARVEELAVQAQREATKDRKVPTCLRDLLDDECRRLNTPLTPTPAAEEDDEIDMDALMASVPLHGTARRNR